MDSNNLIRPVESAVDIAGRTTLGRFGVKSRVTELRHRILPPPVTQPSFYDESESGRGGLSGAVFSPENSMVTLENDVKAKRHCVKIWDMTLCRPVKLVKAHQTSIYNIIKSNDMKFFATVSLDRTAKIFDLRSFELVRRFDYEHVPCRVTMSDDSRFIVISDVLGRIIVNDAATGGLIKTIETSTVPHYITISKDNGFILATREDSCFAYDFHTGRLVRSFELIAPSSSGRAKTSSSQIIIVGGRPCYVECSRNMAFVKDLFSGSAVACFDHGSQVTHSYINTRNCLMTLSSDDFKTSVWDMRSLTFVSRIAHADFLNVYITSHEKFLITIDDSLKPSYGIGLFDVATGELLADIYCAFENGYKYCVATGPDEAAKNGWISTNIPEMIEVLEAGEGFDPAGTLALDDGRRLEYIKSINRGDIVAARLNDREKYNRIIDGIKYDALENKISSEKKATALLEYPSTLYQKPCDGKLS